MKKFEQKKQKILVTGSAGFVGYHVASDLVRNGHTVHGIDYMSASYYDPILKDARLNSLNQHANYYHHKIDLSDKEKLDILQDEIGEIDSIIHLAAQGCVLRSFEFPHEYVQDNIVAFQNVLELYAKNQSAILIYASSSSVYGQSDEGVIVNEDKKLDMPVSIYGATKIANEVMAQAYFSYHKKPIIGLRFFKVYGPWARPDTVFFKFAEQMINDKPIKLHNHGKIKHSFTYIDDVTNCISGVIDAGLGDVDYLTRHPVYNLGGPHVMLGDCVDAMERAMGKSATRELVPLPKGDRWYTFADSSAAKSDLNFNPDTPIDRGINEFIDWFRNDYIPLSKQSSN